MNIIKVDVAEKYHEGFYREDSDITEIVIHGTGGGHSAHAVMDWMRAGERAADYRRGIALFHYLIDFNGDIYQLLPLDRWVFHSSSGQHDRHTIGIEFMNSSWSNKNAYELEQYDSGCHLISDIMSKYKIDTIIGHGKNKAKYSGGTKNCPGNFDFRIIADHLIEDGFSVGVEEDKIEIA